MLINVSHINSSLHYNTHKMRNMSFYFGCRTKLFWDPQGILIGHMHGNHGFQKSKALTLIWNKKCPCVCILILNWWAWTWTCMHSFLCLQFSYVRTYARAACDQIGWLAVTNSTMKREMSGNFQEHKQVKMGKEREQTLKGALRAA